MNALAAVTPARVAADDVPEDAPPADPPDELHAARTVAAATGIARLANFLSRI
jgi:hypothetical protein